MIEVRGLEKRFGRLAVLRGVDLRAEPGAVTAVVGPNGSGKTTLIKSILGLVRPDGGRISVGGVALNGQFGYRRRIGYMPQAAAFPENLTPAELLRMLQDLRRHTGPVDRSLFDTLRLGPEMEKPLRTLSGGNRQKVSAALAFLFDPDVLILDEPTAGLDPLASSALKDAIRRAREVGKTIVLTSHVMSELEELSDVLVFLLDGLVRWAGPTRGLVRSTGEANLERAVARLMMQEART